jgi:hypothetical protein
MAEVIVSGQKFKIEGDQPTSQEQLAIETFLGARNFADEKTGSPILDQGEFTITPEDVLTDAQKGKYNQDTEDFLSSPDFKRIVAEVGLSIAGGIAGMALAPITGGGSLVATAGLAARVARIARPLLNISAGTVRKIGFATAGAAAGGGTGAAIAQAWDPKESIVKEIARGAAQGAFGEILGFGMAGGLAKAYNKVATGSVNKLQTADAAVKVFERQKAYYTLLGDVRQGKTLTSKQILEVEQKYGQLTSAQKANLKSTTAAQKSLTELEKKYGGDFLGQVKAGSITPAMITENAVIDQLQSIAESSLFGGSKLRAAAAGARVSLVAGIDDLVENSIRLVDDKILDPQAFGVMVQNILKNSEALHTKTLTQSFAKINAQLGDNVFGTVQTNAGKVKVFDAQLGKTVPASNLQEFLAENMARLEKDAFKANFDDATQMLRQTMESVPNNATFQQVANAYRRVSEITPRSMEGSRMRAEIIKRLAKYMEDAPLPTALRTRRNDTIQLLKLGNENFNKSLFGSIAKKDIGQEKIYQTIVRANQKSVTDKFLSQLNAKTPAGSRLIPLEEAQKIESGIKGHFFKDFLKKSTVDKEQYTFLDAAAARRFVQDDYADFINKGGLINKNEAKVMNEYVQALRFAEGNIFRPGTVGKGRGTIFVQLKEAGAITQLGATLAVGTGAVDFGQAGVFILGPTALARLFANPRLMKLVTEGMNPAKISTPAKYTRFMSQLGSGLVGNNIITEDQNNIVQQTIKENEDQLARVFDGDFKEIGVLPLDDENPAKAPEIGVDIAEGATQQPQSATPAVSDVPLPNVTPSSLPMGGSDPQRMQLAQTLNLFNEGGIVSAKKVNQ